MTSSRTTIALALLALAAACGGGDSGVTGVKPDSTPQPVAPRAMSVLGNAQVGTAGVDAPYTAEVAVRGTTAYTSTWSVSSAIPGNVVHIWDVSGDVPLRVGQVTVPGTVRTTGDVAISDDGRLLMVATEPVGSIAIFRLDNPRAPVLASQFQSANTTPGVHTAKFGRVNGTLHAFLSIPGGAQSKVVIVDVSDPAAPREVVARPLALSFVHDVFYRDGLLFVANWNDGLRVWDLGGGGRGGTPANPVELGRILTVGGQVHNVWWFKDPQTGSARYAFVGQEGPGSVGNSASGDIHVVDVSDFSAMKEVAVYGVPGAGTHNFWMDEAAGVLYAAYYNGGVRGLNVRGDLSACTAAQKTADGRCSLSLMGREVSNALTDRRVYVWGVQFVNGHVYASDMLNGLWKLRPPTP